MTTWSDKLVAEVVRLLLEAYYGVQFSDRSHGFRPDRGCHTALREVATAWTGTHWFIEGDISDCFGPLDHKIMVGLLAEKIHDGRFLRLIERMLQAGYLEDWKWNATISGAPQGGTASPILLNIYLDRLDQFVEHQLLPKYNQGGPRCKNPAYVANKSQIEKAERRGDLDTVKLLKQQRRRLPSGDPNDPGFRRLKYVRYCDDWLLGFAGPKHEASKIKSRIQQFLHDELKLELSESKTLITHATSQAARFLGYKVRVQHEDTKLTRGRRAVNGVTGLYVPNAVIRERCARYMRDRKPAVRGQLFHDSDFTIVGKYGAEYRGFVQYYLLAQDVFRLSTLRWVMETSMLKTLAAKHRSTVPVMARAYKATISTPVGDLFRGCGATRCGKKATGRPLRRDPTHPQAHRRPDRPTTDYGQPWQRADPSAPRREMRDLRRRKGTSSPPPAQARRSQQARSARSAAMDDPDGSAATQDSGGRLSLPPQHPCRTGPALPGK